jgi:hypothetical protein
VFGVEVKVGVNGYGTIGKRVALAVAKQDDMRLVGIVKKSVDAAAFQAVAQGLRLYVPGDEDVKVFESAGLKVEGTLRDLLGKVDVIVDATPGGVGQQYKPLYEKFGVKQVYQGGEKPDVAEVSFNSLCNYEEDQDAWRALFKALSYPEGFSYLRIGLDPGATCSLAAYADKLLVWVEKLDCRSVGERVKWLIDVVKPRRYSVNIGSGPGFEELVESLLGESMEFNVVYEEATTAKPVKSKLRDYIKDEDMLAAMTIALIH